MRDRGKRPRKHPIIRASQTSRDAPICDGATIRSAITHCHQSPSVSNEALPPAAVVFTVTVFSVAKRGR